MQAELAMVLGIVIGAFAVPAMVSAYSDRRPPVAPAASLLFATGLVLYAMSIKPGGFALRDIPDAFYMVLGPLF